MIQKYRKEAGLTQTGLAKRIKEIDQSGRLKQKNYHGYISRIETGKEAPSLEYLEIIIKILNKSEGKFFHDLTDEYLQK